MKYKVTEYHQIFKKNRLALANCVLVQRGLKMVQ